MLRKAENYCAAVERLREAIEEQTANPDSTVIRDGVIQRFEFTFELAWKSLKEYMEDQGAAPGLAYPKTVLKAAFADGTIDSEQEWLDMLDARNMTSHVYSDDQASQVVSDIRSRFMVPLEALARFYAAN